MSLAWSLFVTFLLVIAFRGAADLMVRRMIPWPSLYGTDDDALKEEDVINRRRVSFWRSVFRLFVFFFVVLTLIWIIRLLVPGGSTSWVDSTTAIYDSIHDFVTGQQLIGLLFTLPFFFLFNALIFLGPMMLIGVSQMRGFEPGDADWGVRLQDVRGQEEAKQEVSRVVTLWQSGRGLREGRRQARARPALPRRARHREDDAREGDRHGLQLSLRPDARVRVPADVHGDGRRHRPLARAQGEEARAQVGRPVHRLHRRDRRGRHAARCAGRRSEIYRAAGSRTRSSTASSARSIRPAT